MPGDQQVSLIDLDLVGQAMDLDHAPAGGNSRLRTTMVELSWLWIRYQPGSALARWFQERVQHNGGRLKKPTSVALARKLLIALWKYATAGVVIEGAVMKAA